MFHLSVLEQNEIEAIRFHMLDHIHEVLRVVVNRDGPEFGQYGMFAGRGGPIHDEIGQFAQLEQCGTDAAARTNDKYLVAGLDLYGPMKHLIG